MHMFLYPYIVTQMLKVFKMFKFTTFPVLRDKLVLSYLLTLSAVCGGVPEGRHVHQRQRTVQDQVC